MATTSTIAGAEALLRWNHPRDGLRMPSTFVPIAEKTRTRPLVWSRTA